MSARKRNDKYKAGGKWPRPGKRPKSTAGERVAYAREQWEADPNIPINGNKGMVARLMEVFGVTVRDAQLIKIRQEVLSARKGKSKGFSNTVLKSNSFAEAWKARHHPEKAEVDSGGKEEHDSGGKEAHEPAKVIEMPKKDEKTAPLVKAPGAGRSRYDARVRYDFARSVLQRSPDMIQSELQQTVAKEFGIGISSNAIGNLKRELGVGIIKRRTQEGRPRPRTVARIPLDQASQEYGEGREPSVNPTSEGQGDPTRKVDDSIKAAIQLLLSEVPNLRKLRLDIDEDGKPAVAFELRVTTTRAGKVEL